MKKVNIKPAEAVTQTARLLAVLERGGAYSVNKLLSLVYHAKEATSARLAARIYDLKQRGYKIITHKERIGRRTKYSYELIRRVKLKKRK